MQWGCWKEAMVSMVHYLLLLGLGCGGPATGAQETPIQVIKATESHTVFLPCPFDPELASDYLDLTWVNPSGELLLYTHILYLQSDARLGDMWGLLLYNTSRQDNVWFTCKWNGIWGTNHTLTNRIDLPQDFSHPARRPEFFPCDAPIPNNWTEASLSWVQLDSLAQETLLMKAVIWHSARYRVSMRSNAVFLILPSVTSNDTGNYTCQWNDYKHHIQVEVMAKSGAFWLVFGHQHWIIWTVALGYIVVCLSFLFCFLWHRHSICAHKQQMKLRSHARRGYFHAKRNKARGSNGTVASPANQDGTEQVDAFSYENVLPVMIPRRNGRRLLQKGKVLPNTINMEDEEEYECPDSETEHKSDDDDNYENTQEEVKQGEMVLKDASLYENKDSKGKSGSHNWVSADGENYENLEEETPVSPGAMRLIAGLRLHLAQNPPSDKQDGVSGTSTRSQSYEEMNGSLSHTVTLPLHLQPNTSNEEDADSYENMESPNGFNSRHEGNLDPHGEGVAFGSPWQHRSIPLNVDLTGGRLCSD